MKNLLLTLSILFCTSAISQSISYNYIVDSTDVEVQKVKSVFETYIKANYKNDSLKIKSCWNKEEQMKYKDFDFVNKFFIEPSVYYFKYPIHVMSITSKKGVYTLNAMFYSYSQKRIFVLQTAKYLIKKVNDEYKLFNYFMSDLEQWKHNKVGFVDFYSLPNNKFNKSNAKELNQFILNTCSNLGVTPTPLNYYYADNEQDLHRMLGIEYLVGEGGEFKPLGKSTPWGVFCVGLGEKYKHEVFHYEIDKAYPNKHYWVSEGIAVFLGGSRGNDLKWLCARTINYLNNHPEIRLTNILELSTLDEYVDYRYVLGGLIAKRIFEKGRWSLIKQFMNSGKEDNDYYSAIENLLGINRVNLDSYLREQLLIESTK